MSGTFVVLEIAGDVALLLWGTHMVTSGVLRGYGTDLRRWLGKHLNNRFSAFMFGLIVTALLQSSTATSLMATSFASKGFLDLTPGLVVMLGANVGTTLVAQALSFDVAAVAPILILLGFAIHRRSDDVRWKNIGRVGIGLGLMLLALSLLVHAMSPVENSAGLRAVLQSLTGEPIFALALAALLTWACHSSVAVVLLIAALGSSGVVGAHETLALVLGANLGGTLPPLIEAGSPVAKRLPLGNLLVRAFGCLVCLPLLGPIASGLEMLSADPARMAVNFHTAFNLALALVFIVPVDAMSKFVIRLLPEPPRPADLGLPLYLDEAALSSANVALANATRETMRLVNLVEDMLRGLIDVFQKDDPARAAQIGRMDSAVDRLGSAIREYLADLGGEALNEDDGARSQEILAFVLNAEHIGDITANNLIEFAAKQRRDGRAFTAEEMGDIRAMHAQVLDSMRLGMAVFLNGDVRAAQDLVASKHKLWQLEANATDRYLRGARERRSAEPAGGDVYLRILRDLKRVHSHLTAFAYPILERAGLLQDRLVGDHNGNGHSAASSDNAAHVADEPPPATQSTRGEANEPPW
jgi:phosphate:Na+ symporter